MPNNIIDSIQLSGVTYGIKGSGGTETIELTQAEYDALAVKDPNTFYIITDATAGDLTNYYTKTETDDLLDGKQATLQSGTNIKTINNESILGSGNIDIQGGSSYTAGNGIDITNDVISVTGKVDTSAFTAHTADTVIHVTSTEKATWNAKSDFSGDYNDLDNKPTIPTVPTSNTAFTNDAGYITSSALNGYATTGDVQTATNDMATKTWVGNQGYLTEHQSLSNYYTKSETSGATQISTALASKADTATTYTKTQVDTALGGKQATLVSGTNIKTINNESILGSGNIDIQGGGASYSAGTGIDITNDVISVSEVSHNSLADGTKMLLKGDVTTIGQNYSNIGFDYYYGTSSNKNSINIKPLTINGNSTLRTQALSISVVETSAITTSVTSSSTDAQVPSAKAVNDKLGGLSLVKLTQAEYDALSTKDSNTLYVIVN